MATYASGSGSTELVFNTTIKAGQNAAALAVTAVRLSGKAAITGAGGQPLDLTAAVGALPGPVQVDTTAPVITAVTANPASGTFATGATVTLATQFSEAVTVNGSARPSLKLNDGGVATYLGGSGTDVLTFGYTVAAGQSTPALEPNGLTVPRGTKIADLAGNAAVLTGARTTLGGIISINTTPAAPVSNTMDFIGGSSFPAAPAALPALSDVAAQAASDPLFLGLFGGSSLLPVPSPAGVVGGIVLPTGAGALFPLLAIEQVHP